MKLAFADCETTGIRPDMGAELWEAALIIREDVTVMHPDREPTPGTTDSEYAFQVRPDLALADPAALKIGGYYKRCQVAQKPAGTARNILAPTSNDTTAAVMADLVATRLAGALIIGANPWFDAGHLDAFLRKHGQCLAPDYHMVDIGSLVIGWQAGKHAGFNDMVDLVGGVHRDCGLSIPAARQARPPYAPVKLSDAARFAGLDPAGYEAHTALGDARLVRDIWDAVTK